MDVARLADALPEGTFLDDPELLGSYSIDVTGRFEGVPLGVARPRTVQEVGDILRVCNDERVAVVCQGGNTGLVGGAIAAPGQIILSLERFTQIEAVDEVSASVVAGAGASLEMVQGAARSAGLEFPVDFGARSSATIGGMVSTNAGGAFVMRYGTMRDRVLGLQVVLANGSIIDHLHRPPKDSSGFDITQLIPGSEGTLGVVTKARLSFIPSAAHRIVALVAFDSFDDAVAMTDRMRKLASVEAVDFFLDEGLVLVMNHAGLPAPFPERHAAFLVVSCAGDTDPTEDLAALLQGPAEVRDVAVAQSAQQEERLWRYRELHNESINAVGIPIKLDVAVRTEFVPELRSRVDSWLKGERPEATAYYYGHLGDGNVHINIVDTEADDAIEGAILGIVAEMGGSISAEHGIGQAKSRWLHLSRSPEEIDAMRMVKAALDPNGILNPGKLLNIVPN